MLLNIDNTSILKYEYVIFNTPNLKKMGHDISFAEQYSTGGNNPLDYFRAY